VIPDTQTIVNEADPLEPKLNLDFLEYAQSRGFTKTRPGCVRPVKRPA
jgi:hypothetical protein